MDEVDFSEQLGWGDSGILCLKSIASSDQVSDFLIAHSAHYAVRGEFVIANKKRDIAWKHLAYVLSTNQEDIAGPHGRNHAEPRDLQSQTPERAQNLLRQPALRGMHDFKPGVVDGHRPQMAVHACSP
jgi:hypothetical protein